MITCRTLGPVELVSSETKQTVELKGNKNRALLFYLARSPRKSRSREHLVGLLWAEKPEEKARHSLREAVRILRLLLGEEGLESDSDHIRIVEDAIRLDTDDFERLEAASDWAGASDLVAGEFLAGLNVKDAWTFEEWLTSERAFWRGQSVRVFAQRCDELLAAGQTFEAIAIAMRAHTLDAGSGVAVRAIMKSLALAGERSKALEHYDTYLKRLEEVGAEPDADTQTLMHRVQRERSWQLPTNLPVGHDKGAESRRAPLFGRTKELSLLVSAWEKCLSDKQAAVGIVEGDSGTGKTRLAEELTARARLAGAAVATFRAVDGDLETPGTGLVGLGRGGLFGGSGLATASPRALGAFAEHIPEWADRFGIPKGDTLPLSGAIVEVVRAITGEQPVFMLVDDAHWSDAATLPSLVSAVRDLKTSPLFVCFSFAPLPHRDELDDLSSRVGRDTNGVTVRLNKLDEAALHELTGWAMPDYTSDEVGRLTRRVVVDSAGLPLLAVELLHAVALGLDLDQTRGAWPQPMRTLSQTLPGDLPDAIIGAIRVGFRRLSSPAQKALAAAAILDSPTTAERLGRGADLADDKLDVALDELEWQRWLASDARGYSFVARIVRDVVGRDMITGGQKRRILDAAAK